ncbi:MAG: N-acetylmuramoyl-L-alanine amidase [Armatimonadota bacterium]|nr:N-acetylmuramoyl-L-alanine amidase [Armatimonadota bacterium]
MRQGISKAIILLMALLAASSAFSAPTRTNVLLGSRAFQVDSTPVTIDGAVYVSLDVVSQMCSSYVSSGRIVEIALSSGDRYELPVTLHKGRSLVSLTDLAKATDVNASWEPAANRLRLIPHVTGVTYTNGVLAAQCNYPVRFKARLFEGLNVFAVDVSPAVLEGQTTEIPIGEGSVVKARVGQFGPNEVRIAIDLTRPVKLVAAAGKKPNEIRIPIAPKPVSPKPVATAPKPTPGQPPTPGAKPEVTLLTFQPVDDEKSKLLITTTGKVTTRPFVLKQPDRVVVDLIGAKLAAGAGEETLVSHSIVQSVRAAQFQENPDIVRVVLDLTRPATFSIMQAEPTLVTVEIGVAEAKHGIRGATIVIDPGHGGSQSGAVSLDGVYYEKTINLAVARKLTDLLQAAGAYALMTRYSDTAIGLPERPRLATEMNADLFVSLHCNSIGVADRIHGTETYYHMQDAVCRDLAEAVQNALTKAAGTTDRGARSDSRIYANGGFSVLRNATVPAILVEMGYIDHSADRKKLISAEYQQKFAQGIFDGLKAFLGGETIGASAEIDTNTYQP